MDTCQSNIATWFTKTLEILRDPIWQAIGILFVPLVIWAFRKARSYTSNEQVVQIFWVLSVPTSSVLAIAMLSNGCSGFANIFILISIILYWIRQYKPIEQPSKNNLRDENPPPLKQLSLTESSVIVPKITDRNATVIEITVRNLDEENNLQKAPIKKEPIPKIKRQPHNPNNSHNKEQ